MGSNPYPIPNEYVMSNISMARITQHPVAAQDDLLRPPNTYHIEGMDKYTDSVQNALLVNNDRAVVFFSHEGAVSTVEELIHGELMDASLSMYFLYTTNDNPLPIWVCNNPSFVVVRRSNVFLTIIDIFQQDSSWAPIPVYTKYMSEDIPSWIEIPIRDLLCAYNQDIVRRRSAKIASLMNVQNQVMDLSRWYRSDLPLTYDWECYFVYGRRAPSLTLLQREFSWMVRSSQLANEFLHNQAYIQAWQQPHRFFSGDLHVQSTSSQRDIHQLVPHNPSTTEWRYIITFRYM